MTPWSKWTLARDVESPTRSASIQDNTLLFNMYTLFDSLTCNTCRTFGRFNYSIFPSPEGARKNTSNKQNSTCIISILKSPHIKGLILSFHQKMGTTVSNMILQFNTMYILGDLLTKYGKMVHLWNNKNSYYVPASMLYMFCLSQV